MAVGLAVAAGAVVWGLSRFERPGPSTADTTLVVPRGAGVTAIARQLGRAGVVEHSLIFALGTRLFAGGRPLRAGEYLFPAGIGARAAMQQMLDGRTVQRRLVVAEGLTAAEVLALVAAAEGLEGEAPPAAEGALLPETYFYSWGDDRAALVARMAAAMQDTLAELWAARAPGLPLDSAAAALTLASIVEKETALAAERPRVAAVFLNRLRRGMKLQSDPTVIYALAGAGGALDRPLTRADLAAPSPYNTYLNAGLPPGPIANPGRAAIAAVLQPAATRELYFVADGNGGHAFAETLDEHNRNVAAWRKLRAPDAAAPP
ncbi:MAG: endolytic transglycosylase MltG, partial [Dongiaceae bacterium]